MATFQQRRDPMRLMWRRVAAIALLLVIAFMVRAVCGVYHKSQESAVLKVEADAKLNDLQTREQELRTDIANLKSDEGVEAELRERYDLSKEGESVVVIVDPPAPPQEPKPNAFQRFKSWFRW